MSNCCAASLLVAGVVLLAITCTVGGALLGDALRRECDPDDDGCEQERRARRTEATALLVVGISVSAAWTACSLLAWPCSSAVVAPDKP